MDLKLVPQNQDGGMSLFGNLSTLKCYIYFHLQHPHKEFIKKETFKANDRSHLYWGKRCGDSVVDFVRT